MRPVPDGYIWTVYASRDWLGICDGGYTAADILGSDVNFSSDWLASRAKCAVACLAHKRYQAEAEMFYEAFYGYSSAFTVYRLSPL